MRFKLATACNDSSHDSPNDPGRTGLVWKSNYALRGRTLTRAHAHARVRAASSGVSATPERASAERTMPTCWGGAEARERASRAPRSG
jgi:hypothetical protein